GGWSERDTLPRSSSPGAEVIPRANPSILGQTEVRLWAVLRWPWPPLEKGHSLPRCNRAGTVTLCLCYVPRREPPPHATATHPDSRNSSGGRRAHIWEGALMSWRGSRPQRIDALNQWRAR